MTKERKIQLQIAQKGATAINFKMIPAQEDFFLRNEELKRCLDRRILRGDDRAFLRECDDIRAQRFRFTPEEKLNR